MALTKLRGNVQIALASIDDSLVSATAGIQTSKLADAVKFIFNDGSRAFTAPVAGVTPTDPTHLATKGYVDGISISFANVTRKPTTLAGYGITDAVASSIIGAANGLAGLDATGKVPAAQLPSYVDDVVEGANLAVFPGTGETGKIYVALDTNKVYRWSGTVYVEISAAPGSTDAVVEGVTNLYFTAARAQAAVTSVTGNAGTATKLATARSIAMTGDVTWSIAAFDGSANVTAAGTLANSGVTAGTYKSVTVDAKGRVTAGTNPTTLAGYGITDAQALDADLTAIAALAGTSGFLKKTAANTWALDTSTFLTANQTITLSGDATGSGTTAITVTLANSGVAAGTYNSVTVNAKGLVTAASNVLVLTAANIVTRETPSGLVNGSNTTFTLANTPIAGTEEVFINGLLMEPGAGNDYTISGAVITTLFTLQAGDKIRVSYFK